MRGDTARSMAYEHDVNKQTFGASNKPSNTSLNAYVSD